MTGRLWKIVAAVAAGLVLALAVGWLWGSRGRWDAERELSRVQAEHVFTESRARLLAARVDLYALNFGSAASNLQTAKRSLQQALASYDREEQPEVSAALQSAVAAADEAGRLAAEVNPSAQAAAERALADLQRADSRRPR